MCKKISKWHCSGGSHAGSFCIFFCLNNVLLIQILLFLLPFLNIYSATLCKLALYAFVSLNICSYRKTPTCTFLVTILMRCPSLQGTVLSAGAPYKAMFRLAGYHLHNGVIFWNDSVCSGGDTGIWPRALKHLFFF